MKYDFDEIHWQEFETLAFRVAQILIATGVQFINGGSDKGRDMIYSGTSPFNPVYSGDWVLQVKHKSRPMDNSQVVDVLRADLKDELKKVFVTNNQKYNVYILVTNKAITAEVHDQLFDTFVKFKKDTKISCEHFMVLGYEHFASTMDRDEQLKWTYPNVIAHPDFAVLIRQAGLRHLTNRQKAWMSSVEKQKDRFVVTRFYERAIEKLEQFPAIILSGPPKSGKTFNAEILTLNYYLYKGFDPVVVETLNDIEAAIDDNKKQLFIFDDAFGKYSLSFESREWFSRLMYLFSLADTSHLFIFTSREYIFREYVNLGNEGIRDLLNKILVESHNYLNQEKLAMLCRYTKMSPLADTEKGMILANEKEFIAHRNFSPETIRAFFLNLGGSGRPNVIKALKAHLDQPDDYLGQVFRSLAIQKQAALIALFCCVQNGMGVLKKTYAVVCKDLAISSLLDAEIEYDELDDSIVRISRGGATDLVRFYHPSMAEFLIRQVVGGNVAGLKDVIFQNLNTDLLELSQLSTAGKIKITTVGLREVIFEDVDLVSLATGLQRLIDNQDSQLHQITELFGWFSLPQHTMDVKMGNPPFFNKIKVILFEAIQSVFQDDFFFRHLGADMRDWAALLKAIDSSAKLCSVHRQGINVQPLIYLVSSSRGSSLFWILVMRSLFFLDSSTIRKIVGRGWLNGFYTELNSGIDELGLELYGPDYPLFREYEERKKCKEVPLEKIKQRPNRTWYPRLLRIEERVDALKEVKGHEISNAILQKLIGKYNHVVSLKEYAKNRHRFIASKGWWASADEVGEEQ